VAGARAGEGAAGVRSDSSSRMIAAAITHSNGVAKPPLLLVLAIFLGGCAPGVADIREQAPRRVVTVPGMYDTVALCILDAIEGNRMPLAMLQNRFIDRRREQRATITGWVSGGVSRPIPSLEITAVQAGDQVTVEIRGESTWPESVVPAIEGCSGRR
jgi:hypothetical protein